MQMNKANKFPLQRFRLYKLKEAGVNSVLSHSVLAPVLSNIALIASYTSTPVLHRHIVLSDSGRIIFFVTSF